jgi:amino acid adenylation domain-containing protein
MSSPEALSDAKRALLEQRLRGRAVADSLLIPRRQPDDEAVLSPGQRRLWFLHQLARESAAYTMFDARLIRGPLDATAIEQGIAALVRRHEILRTVYPTRDGRPVPMVQSAESFGFETAREARSSDAAHDGVRDVATEFVRRPFDLENGPVFRSLLVSCADDSHVLVLAIHHIACDEWSLGIIWHEIAAGYAALRRGEPVNDTPPTFQYADFAAWQKDRLAAPDAERHMEYWKQTLTPAVPQLELPPDYLAPLRRSYRGGIVSGTIDALVTRSLATVAREAGATAFVLRLAAFAVLLHRWTAQTDLVVGVPATGRTHQALEPVIGFFLNSLPVRVDVSGDPTFRELLPRVQKAFLDAISHQDTPFEAIVHGIAPERQLGRNPLFQVMVVEQTQAADLHFGRDTRCEPYPLDPHAAKFDLTLFTGDAAAGASLMLEYDTDRFREATATRWLDHYSTLLQSIARSPDAPISRLQILSPAERARIEAWSWGPPLTVHALPVHESMSAVASANPDRVAVVTDRESLTYADLNRRARDLAQRLAVLDVHRNDAIGLFLDRSPEMIAGIFGILQAGAAYVPLDPAYPSARHDFAIRDAGVRIIVTVHNLADAVPASDARIVCIDDNERAAGRAPDRASFDDIAYILHTSGSTGRPKGVPISHANLAHSTLARSITYPEPPAVFLLLPSFAFDSSVAGIFWTLTTGGALALPPRRLEQDVQALAEFIARHHVTHTLCLPSLWEAVLSHAPLDRLASLRTVIVAGEACPRHLVTRHYDALPDVALWNEYGPTEATVWSTVHEVRRDVTEPRVPIGSPIAGTFVRVLDERGEPAPVGVSGELYIGGRGVARGYLNRPEETGVRFVDDLAAAGSRLYRTGDRVRWRGDGNLEYLGRIDQQLKIRGYRIEPGEVEATLRRHPAVADCVVLARSSRTGPLAVAGVDSLIDALSRMDAGSAVELLDHIESMDALESFA